MDKRKGTSSLRSNVIYNILYRISGVIVPLITTPYVSRVLGAEATGVYSYTYTVAWYFVILGCLGFENYGNRQIAIAKRDQRQLNQTFSSIFGLQLVTGSMAVVLYVTYMLFFCNQYQAIAWINILYVISCLFNISWFFYGMEQFKTTAIRTIVTRFLGLVLILAFVRTRDDLWKYVFILAALELLNQVVLWVRLRAVASLVKVSWQEVFSHFRGCAILFIPVLLINIYRMMDKLMLGNMSTMFEVGIYTYADKITEMPFHIVTAIGLVMLPHTTSLIANGEEEKSRKYMEMAMRYNTVFSSAITFGMIAVSGNFSILFFGEEYAACAPLICVMAPMLIVRAWANVTRTQFLIPRQRDKEYIISLAIGTVINLVLNSVLIPLCGALGAAIATLLAESSVAIAQILFTNRELPVRQYIVPNIPFIFAGAGMAVVVYCVGLLFERSWITLGVQILLGAVLYIIFAALYLYKTDSFIRKKFEGILRKD